MSRRIIPALMALVLSAMPLAAADDESCVRESLPRPQTLAHLEALFAKTAQQPVVTESGVTADGDGVEVLLARVGPDGKLVFACVDSPVAAKRFLEVQSDRLAVKAAAEK